MSGQLPTDICVVSTKAFYLPVEMRMPLKFGSESISSVTCLRVAVTVKRSDKSTAIGWGETPLSVTWAWPSESLSYRERFEALLEFCELVGSAWFASDRWGHAIEIGAEFLESILPNLLSRFNENRTETLPYLAALIATSAFDLATHDAFGIANKVDVYQTYNSRFLSSDLSRYLEPDNEEVDFTGKYPEDYLVKDPDVELPVWHLVGGLDPLDESDLTGDEPNDKYSVTLRQWIETDGLRCLKIKLRGNDSAWDYQRIVSVGEMAFGYGKEAYLSADFNCTVKDPEYVNEVLDRLLTDNPQIHESILYVEQPFPHELEAYRIDVQSVSRRKPLFLDESAHDWKYIRLGRQLGWTGVALKTCKTQTGALLSLCWAKAHGMPLMVQDLTNPMLAQIPHVRLAAHAGTIKGVESNGMQFYPAASMPEQAIHPGLFQRRNGRLNLSSISGPGFGYRIDEIERTIV